MKKAVFAASLLLLAIALSGCLFFPPPEEDLTGFKECGDSVECIFESAQAGEQAFAVIREEGGEMPFAITAKIISYGLEDGKSRVKFRIEEIEAKPGEENGALVAAAATVLKGQEMLCLIPEEKFEEAASIGMEEVQQHCSGTLVELLKQFKGQE